MANDPINVIDDKCVGCRQCVKACPFEAIAMQDRVARIDLTKCTVCGACVETCKFDAIVIAKREESARIDHSRFKGVWVLAEQFDGHIESITYELLGEGRKLADDLGMELCAVLLGHDIAGRTQELIERGADKVYPLCQGHHPDDPGLRAQHRALRRDHGRSQPGLACGGLGQCRIDGRLHRPGH